MISITMMTMIFAVIITVVSLMLQKNRKTIYNQPQATAIATTVIPKVIRLIQKTLPQKICEFHREINVDGWSPGSFGLSKCLKTRWPLKSEASGFKPPHVSAFTFTQRSL